MMKFSTSNRFVLLLYTLISIGVVFSVFLPNQFIWGIFDVITFVYLVSSSGMILMLALNTFEFNSENILISVALSLLQIIFLGVVISVLNVSFQLNTHISVFTIIFPQLIVLGTIFKIKGPEKMVFSVSKPTLIDAISVLLIPISIISIKIANKTGVRIGIYFLLLCICGITLFIGLSQIEFSSITIFSIALSVLYHKSLWEHSYPIEMWASAVTYGFKIWHPTLAQGIGQESILTTAVLFPTLAISNTLPLIKQIYVFNPIIVSLIPVGIFTLYDKYIDERWAALLSLFFIFTFRFYSQNYPYGARDVMATFFFVVVLNILASKPWPIYKRLYLILFSIGIVISHYATSYIISIILSIGFIVSILFGDNKTDQSNHPHGFRLTAFVFLLPIFAYLWYAITAGGVKFILISNILANALSFRFGGPSTAVLTRETGLVKLLIIRSYILIWVLIGLGWIYEIYTRFNSEDSTLPSNYVIISGLSLIVVGLTFLPVTLGFSTSRLMMILFPILLIYVYIIMDSKYMMKKANGKKIVSIILVFVLLLNTGMVASIVGGHSPSQVLTNDRLQNSDDINDQWRAKYCVNCNAKTLRWMYYYETFPYYSDRWSKGWHWYGTTLLYPDTERLIQNSINQNGSVIRSESIEDCSAGDYIYYNTKNTMTGHYLSDSNTITKIDNSKYNKMYTTGYSSTKLSIKTCM